MADPTPIPPPPPAYIEIREDEEEMQEHQVAELPIDDESEDEHDLQEEQDPEIPINDDAIARDGEESDEYEHDDDDDDDGDEGAEIDPDYAVFLAQQFASGFPHGAFQKSGGTEAVEGVEKRRRIGAPSTSTENGVGSSQGSELNQSEIDGLFCPICLEAWTADGTHRICCLPCGHIYGMTCIAIWVLRKGKCPQCIQKCKLKDIRRLYASQLVSVDEQSQKRIRALEDKCAALEEKVADCYKKEAEWLKREAALTLKVEELTKRWMEENMDCRRAELLQQQPDVLLEQQLPDPTRSVEVLDNMLAPGTIIRGVGDTMVRDLRSGSSSSSWGANEQSLAFTELRSNVMNLQSDMTNLKSTLQGVIQVLIANGMSIPPQLLQLAQAAQQQPDQQPDHHPVRRGN